MQSDISSPRTGSGLFSQLTQSLTRLLPDPCLEFACPLSRIQFSIPEGPRALAFRNVTACCNTRILTLREAASQAVRSPEKGGMEPAVVFLIGGIAGMVIVLKVTK